jgi:hypothetical protein
LVSADEIYENYRQPLVIFDIRFTKTGRRLFPIMKENSVELNVKYAFPFAATEHISSLEKRQNLTLNWII